MSDIPRFAFFSDGMREGYSESWVRSSDYDALRAERDALAAENSAFGSASSRYTFSGEPSRTAHKAMQKVKPLNKCEIGAFRAAYSDASMMSRFRDAMAARGIEVGE